MNTDPRGYYAALHVTPAATQADIQRAFRALIRLHHPDVGSYDAGQEAGGADVRSILAAFAVLRDPVARAEYDRTAGGGARDIPVRHHRTRGPAVRATPVRWERGPWEGHS